VEIIVLIIRADKLNIEDNKVASLEVAKGGTHMEKAGRVTWRGLKITPIDSIGTFYMEAQNQTSKVLEMVEYCWILRSSGMPVNRQV
jgi:hypothetical protein